MPVPRLDVASRRIRGTRLNQQDSSVIVRVGESRCLLVLADGMGGHRGGDVASATIVRTFCEAWSESDGPVSVRSRLVAALRAANLAIHDRAMAQPQLAGMGSTLVAASVDGARLHWISVGDSPLWLYRKGTLSRLNANHSVAALLEQRVREGLMTPGEAASSPERSQLFEAVSGRDIRLVDAPSEPLNLESGDVLILASDGVETCPDSELEKLMGRCGRAAADLASDILEAVEAHGRCNQDNATLIVLRF